MNKSSQRGISGLSEILIALRMNPSEAGKPPFENYTGVEPNTIKQLVINCEKFISDTPAFPQRSVISIRARFLLF